MRFAFHHNKFFDNKEKSNELDLIKSIRELIEDYNGNNNFHYYLRLKFGVRMPWFEK
ncbi:MAG: hypothetical protein ACRD93_03850 [Nitrososphaeraceae archaeon]